MDTGLAHRTALVVGGSGYIGRAVATALAAEGADVVLAGRTESRLTDAAAEITAGIAEGGGTVGTIVLDAQDDASVASAIAEVVGRTGRIDVLVNTAAPPAGTLDPALDADPASLVAAIEGKAIGYLRVMNAVLPRMREAGYGRVVNVSGQNARLTIGVTPSTRNAAVSTISKSLADSLAGTGVTINVVDPGLVTDEPSTEVRLARGGDSTPQQVAALIVFLASEAAGAISGETVAVGHRALGFQ